MSDSMSSEERKREVGLRSGRERKRFDLVPSAMSTADAMLATAPLAAHTLPSADIRIVTVLSMRPGAHILPSMRQAAA